MIDIFEHSSYREITTLAMAEGKKRRPRGAVGQFAKALQCHATLVAHILNGKSHMTCEQGTRAAKHFGFDEIETDYFLTLILWERAGDLATKQYFKGKLEAIIAARSNLRERWKISKTFSQEQEEVYYSSWLPMAVHLLTHIKAFRSTREIASKLRLDAFTVEAIANDLLKLGMIEKNTEGELEPANVSVHLGKGSPALQRCHINMRQKIIQDLTNRRSIEGSNYSSFVTLTSKDAQDIKELVFRQIEEIRSRVKASSPEVMYLHCVDFFEI
jgi:uncharacterized protein (TIGR02147 family)